MSKFCGGHIRVIPKGKEDGDNFNIGYDDILAMFELYSESLLQCDRL